MLTGELCEDKHYKAQNIVSRAKHVNEPAITLEGGEFVILDAGFEHPAGSTFEGKVTPCPTGSEWRHEFVIRDHLGNTRILFADENGEESVTSSEILSEHHYYPFGLEMQGAWQKGEDTRYHDLYNGKERHGDCGWN